MNRVLLRALPFLLSLLALGPPARSAPAVVEVVSVGVTVRDIDASVAFFRDVLAFETISDDEQAGEPYERLTGVFGARLRVVRMRLGDEVLELTEFLAPRGRPVPADSRSNDGWFQHIAIVVRDMDEAYRQLRKHKVAHVSTGPQTLPAWNKAAAGIQAFYFLDPDGHVLELIQFPAGKGDPKWHRTSDRLFLGIDHTAIVVADTDTALKYYRDTLGLNVVGASENSGPEQERLNHVFGAKVRITSLRAATGPGIEFLEYLAPHVGRPMPRDTRPNDLWHWHARVKTSALNETRNALESGRVGFATPTSIDLPSSPIGPGSAFLTRDPDGHALLFTDR